MQTDSVPHISLALHPRYQARELGPLVKEAMSSTDWETTQLPAVSFSPSRRAYRITTTSRDWVQFTHQTVTRQHGREQTDHPWAEAMLSSLPPSLWSGGPTDVGLAVCMPCTFELSPGPPIWRPQYKHKPGAEEGIAETVKGLLASGVLEPSQSSWNTPILPVFKPGTGKWRMAHDLRAINARLMTLPYRCPTRTNHQSHSRPNLVHSHGSG